MLLSWICDSEYLQKKKIKYLEEAGPAISIVPSELVHNHSFTNILVGCEQPTAVIILL